MHASWRWFKPFRSFGVWDEISGAEPAGSWAGNAVGGGFLGWMDPRSLPGHAAAPQGGGTVVKHSPEPIHQVRT